MIRFVSLQAWPHQSTSDRRGGAFRAGYQDTIDMLQKELDCLRARNVVVQIAIQSFCLHDYAETPTTWTERMPPADLSLAHLLLLSCDEEEFLHKANATLHEPRDWPDLWDQTSDAAGRIEQVIHDHREQYRQMRRTIERLRDGEIDVREDLRDAILEIVGRARDQELELVDQ